MCFATGDGNNDLDLVMFLYDSKGRIVASDDNSGGRLSPRIVYRVRPVSGRRGATQSEKFTIQIADIKGSSFLPDAAPRVLLTYGDMEYVSYVWVLPMEGKSSRFGPAKGEAFRALEVEAPGSATDEDNQDNPWIRAVSPNPASKTFSVRVLVPSSGHVRISIYSVDGRQVRSKEVSGLVPGGEQMLPMEANGLAAGVYLLRYEDVSPNHTFHISDTAKIVLVK